MSFIQKFSKLSSRAKAWWILAVLVIFVAMTGLATAGNYFNSFSGWLSSKTNNIVVLPKVKEIPFNLGLDLQGGTHLVYEADVTNIAEKDRAGAMESARNVIERRVNTFGVSEPVVQVNKSTNGDYRIIADLAGIKDVEEAIRTIGETPILEFKEQDAAAQNVSAEDIANGEINLDLNTGWKNTELTGKYLKRSTMQFNPNDGSPEVSLEFDAEGSKIFEEVTARNVGKPVAIFLDGYVISAPTVNEKITGGQASISGRFNIEEAKLLVKRLNSGALPVPITLISQKTVESSLGFKSIDNSLKAGLLGLLLVSLFMILYYRLPGALSVLSLLVYGLTVLAIFKALPVWLALALIIIMVSLIFYTFNELKIFSGTLALLFAVIGILLFFYALKPITLTLSGIAGLILSVGMAVDANILIFARTREEFRSGKSVSQAIDGGFKRAWPSIRDGNVSTIITCFILMFFGTSTIQGFGTTLFIGISVSLFSAIVVTRTLFVIILGHWLDNKTWLFGVRRPKAEINK
jgi:protein-export membrane protein SecD